MKKYYVQLMALSAAFFLLSCDRERSNPIDPQAAVLVERPDTPNGLQAQGGVERILLAWQAIDAPDLAGYACFAQSSQMEKTHLSWETAIARCRLPRVK